MKIEFLNNKIKIILSTLGFNEKYIAFDYLSIIITYLIVNNNDSFETYNSAIEIVKEKYNLATRTITQSLNKILSMCNKTEIINKYQFNIVNNKTLNKIRVVKLYVENKLK